MFISGGFKHSAVIDKHLVSAFLPFLPLEKEHVLMCIRDEVRNIGELYSAKTAYKILKELPWYPKDTKKYSATGCKQVADKVKSYYG